MVIEYDTSQNEMQIVMYTDVGVRYILALYTLPQLPAWHRAPYLETSTILHGLMQFESCLVPTRSVATKAVRQELSTAAYE